MKLTTKQLRQIIKEELMSVLEADYFKGQKYDEKEYQKWKGDREQEDILRQLTCVEPAMGVENWNLLYLGDEFTEDDHLYVVAAEYSKPTIYSKNKEALEKWLRFMNFHDKELSGDLVSNKHLRSIGVMLPLIKQEEDGIFSYRMESCP
jgi:hypothetical protein